MVTPLRDIFSSPADESNQQITVPIAMYMATMHTATPIIIVNDFIHDPPVWFAYQFKLLPQCEQYLPLESFLVPQT